MPLNDTKLRALKPGQKVQKVSDGGGLYIHVTRSGSKLWRLAYRFEGKQKTLSFGSYPATSLANARRRREEAKELLNGGRDPSAQRQAENRDRRQASQNTFGAIADEFLEKVEREGRAEATLTKKRWLLKMAKASLGRRPIRDVSAADILTALRKVEDKGNLETARRLRAVIGQVFRYAIATARTETDPTYGLRGAIATPTVIHRAALTSRDSFARLLKKIWAYEGQPETRIALKLMAILYPRPGELRNATWAEFDLESRSWTIPAHRTKMRRGHRKPLPDGAITLLQELKQFTSQQRLAFASPLAPGRPLSENTLNLAIRKMGFSNTEATSHGFRASASSLLNESGKWSADAIEAELGHATSGQVRRAYHRALYWEERVRMADWWSETVAKMADMRLPAVHP